MKIWIVLAVLICAGAGVWFYLFAAGKPSPASKPSAKEATAKVARGDIRITLSRTGKIDAKESVKIFHKVQTDNLTIASIVPEGTYAKKGQELVTFNNTKQRTDLDFAEADCKFAASEVEIAQQALEIARRENAEALAQAQFKHRAAEMEYEKSEKGELPQMERKMKLEIEKAESEVKQAKESYELIDKEVVAQGFATPADIEKERIRYRAAQIQQEVATSDLDVFRKYTRPVLLNTKQADVETTCAAALMIENVNANKLRQKTAELGSKQEKLRESNQRLELAKEQLAGTILTAPNDGLVLYGESNGDDGRYYRGDGGPIRVGGQIYMNQTVITLPKMDELIVKTSVAEVDVNRVKKGLRVVISSDAYPDLHEFGTVEKIGNVASRSYFEATNNYELVVHLRKGDLKIKPGVSAKLEIEIDELKQVLLVPVNAVFVHEGRNFAYVNDGAIVPRELKLGTNNDTHAVVLEGLKEGESVLLYEPEHVDLPAPIQAAMAPAPAEVSEEE